MNGASGETLAELQRILNFDDLTLSQVNTVNQALINSIGQTKTTGLDIAVKHQLQIKNLTNLQPTFEQIVRDIYRMDISQQSDAGYAVRLINHIAFEGQWLEGFSKSTTKPAMFLTKYWIPTVVKMMRSSDQFRLIHIAR